MSGRVVSPVLTDFATRHMPGRGQWPRRRRGSVPAATAAAMLAVIASACGTTTTAPPAVGPSGASAPATSASQPVRSAAPTAYRPPPGPARWRFANLATRAGSQLTAVAAVSAVDTWAFEEPLSYRARPIAWHMSGSTWSRQPFPGLPAEIVDSAAASADDNVWAFTPRRALRWNGSRWSVAGRFPLTIGSGLVISPSDVWVFGQPYVPGAGLGTWHYDGAGWARIPSGADLYGASALAPDNIWAFGGTTVAHWDGKRWARTSVAAELPRRTALSNPHLSGIYARSPRSIWAVGTGGRQDQGGAFALLHYDGTTWKRLALIASLGQPVAVIPDGRDGLWIPVSTNSPPESSMLRYRYGRLAGAMLPASPAHLVLLAAAAWPYLRVAFAAGFVRSTPGSGPTRAALLRYR